MRDRRIANVLGCVCALFPILCALSVFSFSAAPADAFADAEFLQVSRTPAPCRAETNDLPPSTHYAPPRHELAGHYSFARRTRSSELYGVSETEWSAASAVDRRLHKDAEKASREAIRHAYRAYVIQSIREATEGGKDVFAEPDLLRDWRDALRPILPH